MPILRLAVGLLGIACLALVIIAGAVGPADSSLNPASYLLWLYFWPGLAILVLLVGDLWPWLSPWRALSAVVAREHAPGPPMKWLAVMAFSAFAWFDLASGLSNRPAAVALAALGLSAFLVIPSIGLGKSWVESADPFGQVFAAVGRLSLVQVLRGRPHRKDVVSGWEYSALLALVLGAAIFDALIATPQWSSLVTSVNPSGLQRASPAFIAMRTAGLAIAVSLVGCSFLIGGTLLRPSGRRSSRTNLVATALLPIAVSLMVAHNLPALVRLGPRLPAILFAFVTQGVTSAGVSPDAAVPISAASPLWIAEVAIIVLGLVWSAVIACRLQTAKEPLARMADSYPIWAVAGLISVLALAILYLPVSAMP